MTNAQDNNSDKKEFGGNNAGTTRLIVSGVEDLGGGLKAEFKGVGLFSAVSPLSTNTAAASSNTVAGYGYSPNNNLFNDEIWLGLSGGFGSFKIGSPDLPQHTTNGKIQPFGTAMGGAYSGTVTRFGATNSDFGIAGYIGAAGKGRPVRAERSIRYDTPAFNGFSASYSMAAKNDQQTDANKTSANSNGITAIGLYYKDGPFDLAYASTTAKAGAYTAQGDTLAGTTLVASKLIPNAEAKYVMYGGNYTMGNLTIYAGATQFKTTGLAADLKVDSTNYAVKYLVTPSIELLANVVKIDDKNSVAATAAKDQKLTGLGVNYLLSKRTTAYLRYEDYNTDTSATNKGVKAQAIGILHTF